MALKIKDNIDFKILENYGFKKDIYVDKKCYTKNLKIGTHYEETIIIWEFTREIQVCNSIRLLDTLYELMQANLVEREKD